MGDTRTDSLPELPGYELLSEIGRGGVSTVYLARHLMLERQVAIKVMSPALTVEEGFSKRFVREGQTVARLSHPGIVTVYDVAEVDYRPYIAMEYLPAGSLKERMKSRLAPNEALEILRFIADSLGYAHDSGVYHRDVKPENILFRDNGQPVLTDFGIAKSETQNTALTSVGVVVGTPRYISPEQAQGHECDGRSDIYALGIILYEMLTGAPPFDVKGSMSLLYAHINEPIPRLSPDLAAYQGLVDDLMAKEPGERIADCRSLSQRIDELEGTAPELARGPAVPSKLNGAGKPPRPAWRRRPILGGALLLAMLMLVSWLAFHDILIGRDPRSDDTFEAMVSRIWSAEEAADAADREEEDEADAPEMDPHQAFARARELMDGPDAAADPAAAVRLYERAANNGHSKAQYFLGVAYGNGAGVALDERKAMEWLERASRAGEKGARYNLVLANIFGPEPDPSAAAELALSLADQGYAPVYKVLGWMYNTGTGVEASIAKSVKWGAKTVVGDVTGESTPSEPVVERWQNRMRSEMSELWSSSPKTVR